MIGTAGVVGIVSPVSIGRALGLGIAVHIFITVFIIWVFAAETGNRYERVNMCLIISK